MPGQAGTQEANGLSGDAQRSFGAGRYLVLQYWVKCHFVVFAQKKECISQGAWLVLPGRHTREHRLP